jgi:hypothetical protein
MPLNHTCLGKNKKKRCKIVDDSLSIALLYKILHDFLLCRLLICLILRNLSLYIFESLTTGGYKEMSSILADQ